MLGAFARGQYINFSDSLYMFHRLNTFPPSISTTGCYITYSTHSVYPYDEGSLGVDQHGSIFPADSVERICGIAIVADTVNTSMYYSARRDKAVSVMLYLMFVNCILICCFFWFNVKTMTLYFL